MKILSRFAVTIAIALAPLPALASEANEAVVRAAIEQMLGAGRLELAETLYDPAFAFHGDDRDYGRDELRANIGALREAFPDLVVRVERIVASGDLVSVQWSGSGTNSVRAGGFPGTGRRVTLGGMAFVRMHCGLILEEWAVSDNLALLRQLGLLPAPGGTP